MIRSNPGRLLRRTDLPALRDGDPGYRRPAGGIHPGGALPLLLLRLPKGAGGFSPQGLLDGV